ncbi:MAG TPA: type IV pilus twitching motility protein PilT [Actinomycetota bacterium]|nr:type IV pilus twitching motility protein PilT [Actinomycetota bacterium]
MSISEVTKPVPATSEGLRQLLEILIARKGSDLHLTAGAPPVVRVHGILERLDEFDRLEPPVLQAMLYSILTQRQSDRLEEDLELDLSYSLPDIARFRVNIYFQKDAMGAAFRLIPVEILSLEQLGLPEQLSIFTKMQRGLVLVTGPTGQGKTTTLASLIDIINVERACHIVTIEDPIEFLHQHRRSIINQREVGSDTHSFAGALRHVLRQDPDVILVGEMRDLETMAIALSAAETGHLVLATLHTQDAAQTVDRIIDVFPPNQQEQIRVQLSGSLQGIVTQQLLTTREGDGRVPATEVLFATPAVRNLIREAKTYQIYSVLQSGAKHGMQTMDQSLANLVRRGKIAYETALDRCHDIQGIKQLLGG